MRKKTASQIICQNFKIPSETIFQDYKCTYRSSVLFFGRLYIGEQHFLFIANMFGLVKKCTIKIQSITKIQQSQNFSVITIVQNSDGQEAQYTFGSFKNNNAYQLMRALWKGQKIGSDVFKNQGQEENQQFNKLQNAQGNENKVLIDQGQVQANFFNPQVVESQKQKIVQIQLPCSVDQFYKFFLADNATVYPRRKHLQSRQAKDIVISQWRKSEQLNSQVRQVNATLKVSGVPFVKQAGMSQVWMIKKSQQLIQLNVVTQMADVPYSAYFNCQQHIQVAKQGDKKCRMIVQVSIVFNKSTYMKGTIMGRTLGDMKQEYEAWIKNVNGILDQIRKKKDQSEADKKKVQVQYEANLPIISQKNIPAPHSQQKAKSKQTKFGIIYKLANVNNLKMEQKVNLTLKLVIIMFILNVIIFLKVMIF